MMLHGYMSRSAVRTFQGVSDDWSTHAQEHGTARCFGQDRTQQAPSHAPFHRDQSRQAADRGSAASGKVHLGGSSGVRCWRYRRWDGCLSGGCPEERWNREDRVQPPLRPEAGRDGRDHHSAAVRAVPSWLPCLTDALGGTFFFER